MCRLGGIPLVRTRLTGRGAAVHATYSWLRGFYSFPLLRLTPETVSEVHLDGGTFLGSSRGGFELEQILDSLRQNKINHLYIIGGDGTHRGAKVIFNGASARV